MFKVKLSLPDLRSSFLDLPTRAQAQFRRELPRTVQPALQSLVKQLIAPPPGPVVHPFEFATAKSRAWYFANKVPKVPTGGGHQFASAKSRAWFFANKVGKNNRRPRPTGSYQRTGQIEASWVVIIGFQIRDLGLITVTNLKPASIYVFGPRQVPGHARTGWGKGFNQKFIDIERQARQLVADAWLRSVVAAAKGRSG